MSKIQGKPFIELVVDTLGDLKTDFLDLVNGSDKTPEFRSLINASAKITDSDKGKVQYVVLETWSKTYTGYLIYNNTYCVLVAFSSNTQALTMLKIDVAKQTFTTVKEYLDINELRRYLEEANDHITSGEIDSGEAQQGDVLFADGEGGAEWGNLTDAIKEGSVDEGDVVQIFGFDSQGNLKKDNMPEGIVVDETIVEDSPNAVAGGAVFDALASVNSDVEALQGEMEDKANVDGNYPTMTVGFADNLTPYDESSGDDQDEPFNFQATGTGNGSQPDFSTGSAALMKEKQGNTVVVNQLVNVNAITTQTINGVTITNNDDGTYTLNGTATDDIALYLTTALEGLGHKWLAGYFNLQNAITGLIMRDQYSFSNVATMGILTLSGTFAFALVISNGTTFNNIKIEPKLCDLTQWFGSNDAIPQDLLDHPEHFFRYYQGSLAYNEGTLVNANGRYIKCIGRQQWDEEWELGDYNSTTGAKSSGSRVISKNKMRVVPNGTYYADVLQIGTIYFYDKDENYIGYANPDSYSLFTVPSNACYATFRCNTSYGSTYNHDITISLYYEDETGYDQYYPYEVLTNNDTGTEVLRSAGNVKDSKAPDGTITRRVGGVDLSTLSWVHSSGDGGYYYQAVISDMAFAKGGSIKGNALTENHEIVAQNSVAIGQAFITSAGTHEIYFLMPTDTAPTGTLFYELAEPTTEQGTSYSENLVIDDFGSMDFAGNNGVPQGNLIFYPVDYKAFVDTLYKYTDGAPSKIALKSDLPTAPQSWAESLPGYDATKTQTLKNVNGTLTWVDDE